MNTRVLYVGELATKDSLFASPLRASSGRLVMMRSLRRERLSTWSNSWLMVGMALFAFTHPASAQLNIIENTVNRIENKVDNANDKLNTLRDDSADILAETTGLQSLRTIVTDASTGFRPQVLADLQAGLVEFQDLFEYLRDDRIAAGSSGNYPDLIALMNSLETLVNTLSGGVGAPIDFSGVTNLLQFLPDGVLAVAGRSVASAGIDASFVASLDQTSLDLLTLQAASAQEMDDPSQFLQAGSRCEFKNQNRSLVKAAAFAVQATGLKFKLNGEIMVGTSRTVVTSQSAKVWGWVGGEVKTEPTAAIGKVFVSIGDALLEKSKSMNADLERCESLHYQRAILNELCELNRGRSQTCMDWQASLEAQEF